MTKLPKIIKYVIIGLVIGIIISVVYYFLDYQNKPKEVVVGISKDKVLLADEKEYDLDVILNSIINNQFVLQGSIEEMNKRINLIIKEMENATNTNQSE